MAEETLNVAELVAHERLVRHAACLGFNERVGDFRVVPLTLTKWTALTIMRSPYLPPFQTPTAGDTLALLWILSPEYLPEADPQCRARRRKFYQQKFPFIPPPAPFFWRTWRALGKYEIAKARAQNAHARIMFQLQDYIIETLQDAPAGQAAPGPVPEYYCDAIAIATSLARAYGGGLQQYFEMPMKVLFQAMKENREHHQIKAGQPVVLGNPSDAAADAELEAANRALHASGQLMHPAVIANLEQHRN